MDLDANFNHDYIDEFTEYRRKQVERQSKSPIDWYAKTQKKVYQLRKQIKSKEMEECTFKPSINRHVKVKTRYQQPIQSYYRERAEDLTDCSFRPRISIKSTYLKRNNDVANILYEDAVRRKQQKDIQPYQNGTSNFNMKNNKIAGQKFVKEYSKTLEVLNVENGQLLSIQQMHQVLKILGFVKTYKLHDHQKENTLIYEAYEVVCREGEDGIRVKNLAVFLLSVMGIFNVYKNTALQELNLNVYLRHDNFYRLFDYDGNMIINEENGSRIQKYFKSLYLNKLSYKPSSQKQSANGSFNATMKKQTKKYSANDAKSIQKLLDSGKKVYKGGKFNWIMDETSSYESKTTMNIEPSCFIHKNQPETVYTQEYDSRLLEYSAVYQMTEPPKRTHKPKCRSEIVYCNRPLFVMYVKIDYGCVELPIFSHQRENPGTIIDRFAQYHSLDLESRTRLYNTLCYALAAYAS